MDKQNYDPPVMEISEFENGDVIVPSGMLDTGSED